MQNELTATHELLIDNLPIIYVFCHLWVEYTLGTYHTYHIFFSIPRTGRCDKQLPGTRYILW